MSRKIGIFVLLMTLCLLLLSISPVCAEEVKGVTISELGTVAVPSNIEVSEKVQKSGEKAYGFLVKDKNVFRVAAVFCKTFPGRELEGMEKEAPDILAPFTAEGHRTLQSQPLKNVVIGKKKVMTANITQLVNDFNALNINLCLFKKTNGVALLMFVIFFFEGAAAADNMTDNVNPVVFLIVLCVNAHHRKHKYTPAGGFVNERSARDSRQFTEKYDPCAGSH